MGAGEMASFSQILEGYEVKKMRLRIEIWALALLGVIALAAPSAGVVVQCTPSSWANVFVNQHVELQADPDDNTTYYYDWSASSGVTILAPPGAEDNTKAAITSPDSAGDYTVDVIITNQLAPACSAQNCFGMRVYQCCPEAQTDYCTKDEDTWCWYDSCGTAAPFTPSGSIGFEWYINDAETPVSTEPCYSPDFLSDEGYVLPSKEAPTQAQKVTMKVVQDLTGSQYGATHHSDPYVLCECDLDFNLHWDPEGEVNVNVAFS